MIYMPIRWLFNQIRTELWFVEIPASPSRWRWSLLCKCLAADSECCIRSSLSPWSAIEARIFWRHVSEGPAARHNHSSCQSQQCRDSWQSEPRRCFWWMTGRTRLQRNTEDAVACALRWWFVNKSTRSPRCPSTNKTSSIFALQDTSTITQTSTSRNINASRLFATGLIPSPSGRRCTISSNCLRSIYKNNRTIS